MLKITEAIRHEDNLFAQRANFFLLSQAIFFAAYSQIFEKSNPLKLILIFLGVFTVVVWLIVAIRNILLIKKLRKEEKDILKKKNKKSLPKIGFNLFSSNNLIGIVFPISFLIGWIIVIFSCKIS